ncbi:MAG: hypothetical protein V4494_04890 [Chlamydiota bacterium]
MNHYLAEACENTFLLFDCLKTQSLDSKTLKKAHERLKESNRDDAIILVHGINEEHSFTAQIVVLGLDGVLAEFCGNGARAAAAFLFTHYPKKERLFLRTKYGKHQIFKHSDGSYSILLPPAQFPSRSQFLPNGAPLGFHYVEVFEPHLIFEGNISDKELMDIGSSLNQNKDLFPLGINVNAWHRVREDSLFVKTYERGVQRLTKSCGSGSIACASFYKKKGRVAITTPGGNLEVTFSLNHVELKGPSFFISN